MQEDVNASIPPSMAEPQPGGLVDRARCGDGDAWSQLFRELSRPVAGYLRAQGAREVDDLVSEVFINVFRGIDAFAGDETAFRSWVFVIAHRRLIDERRRRSRRPPADVLFTDVDGPPAPGAEQEMIDATGTARVVELCGRLVPDQRDVLMLRIVGDLTIEQIADMVEKSVGAVKALQRRGLSALRRILSSQGVPL